MTHNREIRWKSIFVIFASSWVLIYHKCDCYSVWEHLPVTGDVGSKLILTPYIESGNITEARNLAKVSGGPFSANIPSYSGFLTVNKTYNSNLFFWFFPAEQNYEQEPLLLWLQGGPGASSLLGLFKEFGPYSIGKNLTLFKNPYSWHKNHSLIFIDNPVGTGFSFTENEAGYATDQVQIGNELYIALIQFLKLFPELQLVPFFVAGESYGGKHAPSLAYTIHERNPTADLKVNLEGIVVGNGFTDPVTLLDYSTYLYQLGLIDKRTSDAMKIYEDKGRAEINQGDFLQAYYIFQHILQMFEMQARYDNVYNFLHVENPKDIGDYAILVQKPGIRRAIHVGDAEYSNYLQVFRHLRSNFMNTVRPLLEVLLDNYRVLYYNGQMDIIVAYPLSLRMYNELQFSASEEYRNATRYPWFVDGELAGYAKFAGNFTEVLVRNSGHLVPMDQPKWAFDLINRFTRNNKNLDLKMYSIDLM